MLQSKVLFDSQHYTACEFKGGLIVTRKRKRGGVHLVGDQAPIWIDAIKTAIDAGEANAMCREILNAA